MLIEKKNDNRTPNITGDMENDELILNAHTEASCITLRHTFKTETRLNLKELTDVMPVPVEGACSIS